MQAKMASDVRISTAAIVAAGGSGNRMGGAIPKQLLEIRNKPVLLHSLEKLDRVPEIGFIVVSVHKAIMESVRESVSAWNLGKTIRIVEGGSRRQDSVYSGLAVVPKDADIVLVHDAVRPFVSVAKFRETIEAAERHGCAILALKAKNTIKRGNGDWVEETLDRSALWEAQTPQAFRRDVLFRAYQNAMADGFYATDDSLLVERLGLPVRIVEGEERNIKITSPVDLRLAEILAGEGACA
jgi:2-C-methyl-D-erythritol 4-phosphate cytidylyltransferase